MFGQTFLLWALSYLLHSTLLFLLSRIVLTMPFLGNNRHKELVLRFALFCAIPTSVLQTVFGVGLNVKSFSGTGLQNTAAIESTLTDQVVSTPASFTMSSGFLAGAIVIIWILVLAFLLVRYAVKRNQFLSGIRPLTTPDSAHLLGALGEIQKALPKPLNITVAMSERLKSPVTVGGKAIYLPTQCADLNNFQLQCLFAHEVAHIARRDNLWIMIYKIVGSIFFFQPLNRVIINDLNNLSEKLCDNWAVEVTGNRFELARCLVTVASWYSMPEYSKYFPGAVTKKSQLKQRIELLMAKQDDAKPMYKKSMYTAFATVMIIMVLLVPGFSLNTKSVNKPVPDLNIAEPLQAEDMQQQDPVQQKTEPGKQKKEDSKQREMRSQRKEDARGPAKVKMTGEQEVNVDIEQNVNEDLTPQVEVDQDKKVNEGRDVQVEVDQEVELDIVPVKPASSNNSTRPKNAGHTRRVKPQN